jgi:hypothetical protein
LFIPVINLECSSLEAPPFFGATVGDRRACLQNPELAFTPLVAELDGTRIVGDFGPYTVTSPNFRLVAVAGNPLIPPGTGFSVSAGTWLLLAPLSPGVHTLHVVGAVPAFDFVSTATYELTVEP